MRLIDLHNNWLQQYAGETTLFEAQNASEISGRLRRLSGYMTDTSVAVLACSRSPDDWSIQPDRWHALAQLIARYEAEFSGRLVIGPDELIRFRSEPPDALSWGVLAVSGFDYLVREPADFERLTALHRRGVRVFQLLSGPSSVLGGCDEPGDDRGLTDLGRMWLERLARIATDAAPPSRLLIDLARQNASTMTAVLDWVEADPTRANQLIPIHSHGIGKWLVAGERDPVVLRSLSRIQSLGGLIAIDPDETAFATTDHVKAAIDQLAALSPDTANPFDGIAISTNYLALDRVPRGLGNVEHLIRWLSTTFEPAIATKLMSANATRVLERMVCQST